METDALQIKIAELLPTATFDTSGEWLNIVVPSTELLPFMQQLRNDGELFFDYLFCLTCVDWKTNLTMVYHLSSTKHRHNIVVKAVLDRTEPKIETVCNIWRTAEMLEREVFELFGVEFLHHPDLRKLILPDDWVGYPLRKDYEDPINMIKL